MQYFSDDDTIAAIATPPGEGGIAIVRVSGPQCFEIADRIFRCRGAKPSERAGGTFVFGRVFLGNTIIDDVLCLVMRSPRSFTGQDTVEFHGHGGSVSIRRVLRAALSAGARSAEAGEFSRRAFLNGKMDLLQAEAVLDVIRAKSDRAATAAIEQLEGGLSSKLNALYDQVLTVAADIEASLDFPEDELPETIMSDIETRLVSAEDAIDVLISSWDEGHLLRDGAVAAIVGRPNAGKSTLMNVLLGRDRAIVSHIPGTTRDVIEDNLIIDGIHLRLLDTAGLRESECEIEREGIRRSRDQLSRADIYIYVIDASSPIHESDRNQIEALDPARLIVVLNKIDLGRTLIPDLPAAVVCVETSLTTRVGIEVLQAVLAEKLGAACGTVDSGAAISERHRALLLSSKTSLKEAISLVRSRREDSPTLAADLLKTALESLGRTTGRIYEEALLNSVFSRFCIGK